MTDAETDAWANFLINFVTHGPEQGERVPPELEFMLKEACAWAHGRELKLDRQGDQLVVEVLKGMGNMATSQLTKQEPKPKQLTLFDLEKLESKVKEGLAKFMEVGRALAEIRDREGYKVRGYKDFESYCEKELKFSLRQGQRLIAAAETAQKVKLLTGEAPRNEATARVLAGIADDEKTVKRVDEALKKKGASIASATAEKVAEIVERVTGKAKPKANGKGEVIAPAPKSVSGLNDHCPNCGEVPSAYDHGQRGWLCARCSATVQVFVTALEGKACPNCSKPVGAEDVICNNCGEVLT